MAYVDPSESSSLSPFRGSSGVFAALFSLALMSCSDDGAGETTGTGGVATSTGSSSGTDSATTTGDVGTGSTTGALPTGDVCPPPQLSCDGATCVDPLNNAAHCGGCNIACQTGRVCVQGVCAAMCPAGQAECAGACIDPSSDADHCGIDLQCNGGQVCGPDQTCVNAVCGSGWSETGLIHQTTDYVSRVRTAVADDGSTQVLWVQSKVVGAAEHYNIWGRRFDAGLGVWGASAAVENQAGGASKPSVGVDADGRITAVWLHGPADGGTYRVQSSRFEPLVGAWTPVQTISDVTQGASEPRLSVDAGGLVHASWNHEFGPGIFGLASSTYDPTLAVWTPPSAIQDAGVGLHSLAAGGGRAIVVWEQTTDAGFDIYASRWIGGTWGPAENIESGAESASKPRVALGATGDALVVWVLAGGPGGFNVHARNINVDTTDMGPEIALTNGPNDSSFPQVVVNQSGQGTAVWLQSDGSVYNLHSASWAPELYQWSGAIAVDNWVFGSALAAFGLTIDDAGYSTLAWPEASSASVMERDAVGSRLAAGAGAWTPPHVLEANSGEVSVVAGAASASGQVQSAWFQTDGTTFSIYGTRLSR